MKTLNRQLRDALRPVRSELRQTPKRVLVARIKEEEANEWLGFVRHNPDITPLRFKK